MTGRSHSNSKYQLHVLVEKAANKTGSIDNIRAVNRTNVSNVFILKHRYAVIMLDIMSYHKPH